jgi:hypothetical protein
MTTMGDKIDGFALRLAKKAASSRGLPDRCIIEVASGETSDKRGAPVRNYVAQAGQIPCRMDGQIRGGSEQVVIEGAPSAVRLQRVAMVAIRIDDAGAPQNVVVKERDRVRVLARGARSEQLLDVQEVGEREGVMIQVLGDIITH